jgi:hypothetical protein
MHISNIIPLPLLWLIITSCASLITDERLSHWSLETTFESNNFRFDSEDLGSRHLILILALRILPLGMFNSIGHLVVNSELEGSSTSATLLTKMTFHWKYLPLQRSQGVPHMNQDWRNSIYP